MGDTERGSAGRARRSGKPACEMKAMEKLKATRGGIAKLRSRSYTRATRTEVDQTAKWM